MYMTDTTEPTNTEPTKFMDLPQKVRQKIVRDPEYTETVEHYLRQRYDYKATDEGTMDLKKIEERETAQLILRNMRR